MTKAPAIRLAGEARLQGAQLFGPLALEMEAGEWTCLLGPSGVGKSTLLRLIAGLETGAEFTGTLDADDGAPLEGRVAFMAQSDLLFPWLDVRGNVGLGARLRGTSIGARLRGEQNFARLRGDRPEAARAEALIARVGLAAQARAHPATLSGGQRQRAALARTLMEDRPVVLLDEPFSALDARTRAEMQELAAGLLAGRSVLLVTHDPAEAARLGHRIYLLREDGLTRAAPPETPPVRAVDDPDTLACQGRLLALLREGP